jgi:formylglycine-generating enzyme required for sulfatase activity
MNPSDTPPNDTPTTDSDLDFAPTLRGLRKGLKLFGARYTLVRQLGRGGMGVVWLARDEKLELEVALKFLPENLKDDLVAVDELRRETKRCLLLTHPNIVRIFDLAEDEERVAIAMEYVEGGTLAALRLEKPARCFEAAEVVPWLRQVCEALSYAHGRVRVVHRDLKPSNIMISADSGRVKLADFGIASSLSDTMSRMTRTGAKAGAGTLVYMSPQQLMGYPPSVRDDVYALGATIYELLTGKPPFFRGSIERQIESVVPPSITERRAELELEGLEAVPAQWEEVIAACLEKEAEKRPQSVAEVWQRLSGAPAGQPPVLEPASSPVSHPSSQIPGPAPLITRSRKPVLLALAALVCVGGALGWRYGYEQPRQERQRLDEMARQSGENRAMEMATLVAAGRTALGAEDYTTARGKLEAALELESGHTEAVRLLEQVKSAEQKWQQEQMAAKMTVNATKEQPFTNSLGMKFVAVPGTQVLMCVHETRNADYAAYAAAQSGVDAEWKEEAGEGKEQHPVVKVSYEDAEGFCRWLSAKEGKTYRLPTDAEWSAAVGLENEQGGTPEEKSQNGSADVFPWGSYFPPKPGDGNYDKSVVDDGYEQTVPVMSFRANSLGIYDLGGNVWEWCQDWYDEDKEYRMLRGASWIDGVLVFLRSSFRFGVRPTGHSGTCGFRCVLVKPGVSTAVGLRSEVGEQQMAAALAVKTPVNATKEQPFTNSLGMKFVAVPGAQVLMCVHETRNADYAAYAAAQSGVDAEWKEEAGEGKEQHPVVKVNYEDAEGFCRWLSAKEGKTYRLPTDAEWSAAVGLPNEQGGIPEEKSQNGSADVFPWGSYFPPKPGDGNYDKGVVDDGYEQTAPVMSFQANSLGIYDLGGNVWEWCQDWYDEEKEYRVLRGASWRSHVRVTLRSSSRYYVPPVFRDDRDGFRCVLVVAGG